MVENFPKLTKSSSHRFKKSHESQAGKYKENHTEMHYSDVAESQNKREKILSQSKRKKNQ